MGEDETLIGLNEEFTSQILSGVRFAPLVMSPVVNTVIPANVWNPSIQHGYPPEFKRASMQLLMCSNSQIIQPPPQVPSEEERFNVAAMLPKSLWLEILSYTHRKCECFGSCFSKKFCCFADFLLCLVFQGLNRNRMKQTT